MRFMDWTECAEVYEALGLAEGSSERGQCHTGLSRCVRDGLVDVRISKQRRNDGNGNRLIDVREYRITQAGKDAVRAKYADYDQRLGEGVAA